MTHLISQYVELVDNIDFAQLESPFTTEEMDNVVKNMHADKSPGPDGFNGAFLKRSWNTVKGQFYQLCQDFHDGIVDIESINTAYITVIPKINSLVYVNDFRALSLVSLPLKFLTKLLANKL